MSGQQVFWRVSSIDDRFTVEECLIPTGTEKPEAIPYQIKATGLTVEQLKSKIPYVGKLVGIIVKGFPQNSYEFGYETAKPI